MTAATFNRADYARDDDVEHALRAILRALFGAAELWGNAYIDREKVDAALREAGLVDGDGELTEFGKRYMPTPTGDAGAGTAAREGGDRK